MRNARKWWRSGVTGGCCAFRLRVLAILLFVKMQFWGFMKITGVIWSLSPVSQRKGVLQRIDSKPLPRNMQTGHGPCRGGHK